MSRGKACRTWTIHNERVRVDVTADGDLSITNMERGTPYQPGKRFAAVDHIIISAAFVPAFRAMLASLPATNRCGECATCQEEMLAPGQGGACQAWCPRCGSRPQDVIRALCPWKGHPR